ncbi:FAD-dependent oxidoreductase [Sphingomonas glaciei]|uniref:FAD-dependent oxidoreductase n=1 Tax=Sphingomonas glaciei TaxID=2938948 RepID=A0ABY5MWY0_9SPHN|nr:FAD-dependent oxidoreductase [Sphingomonas glaciei]UUR06886.1 FAD-dependent oxidoreductase [Sphingomonas glaciei]
MTKDVLVLGAGVVGVATAEALMRRGLSVTLVDRSAEAGNGASFANGGQLSYSYTDALSSPSLLKRLPGILAATDPAFRVAVRFDPAYLRWCLAFFRNGSAGRFAANSLAGLEMALRSRALMEELLDRYPLEFAHAVPGKLLLHEDADGFRAAAAHAEAKRRAGIEVRALTPAEAVGVEPALEGIRSRLAGGIFAPGDAVGDPHLFCTALTERLTGEGLETRFGAAVEGIEQGPGSAVRLAGGERLEARHLVVAAGPQAAALLRPLGWRVPIVPVRGHSLTLAPGRQAPRVSITDVARKLVFCRLGERMRIAGLADVGFSDAAVDPLRLQALAEAARDSLPEAADYEGPRAGWAGLRPVTPDSLPIVARRGAITVNIGHGGLGWTYALATAERAAALVVGEG